jgi:hypothetical protein
MGGLALLVHGVTALPFSGPLSRAFGVELCTPLALATDANGLRGVYADAALRRGDLLLTIPLASCLVATRGPDDDAELAAALLDAVGDESSCWARYRLAHLPQATGAAMLWSEEAIAELQLPAARSYALSLRARCDAVVAERAHPPSASADAWRWALSMVYSRSFALEEAEDMPSLRVLAPMLDVRGAHRASATAPAHRGALMPPPSLSACSALRPSHVCSPHDRRAHCSSP